MMVILGWLLLGWILSLFGIDELVIKGLHELFGMSITTTGYYAIFIIGGIASMIFKPESKSS